MTSRIGGRFSIEWLRQSGWYVRTMLKDGTELVPCTPVVEPGYVLPASQHGRAMATYCSTFQFITPKLWKDGSCPNKREWLVFGGPNQPATSELPMDTFVQTHQDTAGNRLRFAFVLLLTEVWWGLAPDGLEDKIGKNERRDGWLKAVEEQRVAPWTSRRRCNVGVNYPCGAPRRGVLPTDPWPHGTPVGWGLPLDVYGNASTYENAEGPFEATDGKGLMVKGLPRAKRPFRLYELYSDAERVSLFTALAEFVWAYVHPGEWTLKYCDMGIYLDLRIPHYRKAKKIFAGAAFKKLPLGPPMSVKGFTKFIRPETVESVSMKEQECVALRFVSRDGGGIDDVMTLAVFNKAHAGDKAFVAQVGRCPHGTHVQYNLGASGVLAPCEALLSRATVLGTSRNSRYPPTVPATLKGVDNCLARAVGASYGLLASAHGHRGAWEDAEKLVRHLAVALNRDPLRPTALNLLRYVLSPPFVTWREKHLQAVASLAVGKPRQKCKTRKNQDAVGQAAAIRGLIHDPAHATVWRAQDASGSAEHCMMTPPRRVWAQACMWDPSPAADSAPDLVLATMRNRRLLGVRHIEDVREVRWVGTATTCFPSSPDAPFVVAVPFLLPRRWEFHAAVTPKNHPGNTKIDLTNK